jgi:high-affinity iron transporter
MFITWAVFFLHAMFAKKKVAHLRKVNDIVERQEQSALFILAFSAVIREGLEITLFLSTLFLTSQPIHIFLGFSIGIVMGILISFAFFSATLRLPVYYAFRVTSFLLILFAAGMLARGMQEFNELALIPSMAFKPFFFLPDPESIIGQFITSILGVWKHMDGIQVSAYALYAGFMAWRVFIKRETIDS